MAYGSPNFGFPVRQMKLKKLNSPFNFSHRSDCANYYKPAAVFFLAKPFFSAALGSCGLLPFNLLIPAHLY
jgi:hypothetical protein